MRWVPVVFLLLACHRKATGIDAGTAPAPAAEAALAPAPADAGEARVRPRSVATLVEPATDSGAAAGLDAGQDAGMEAAPPAELDAGVDAGAPAPGLWSPWDGGGLLDGGETDLLQVRVGRIVEIRLPRAVVMNVCDAPLVGIQTAANSNALEISGVAAGATHCGFWYARSPAPDRYFRVVVTSD